MGEFVYQLNISEEIDLNIVHVIGKELMLFFKVRWGRFEQKAWGSFELCSKLPHSQ